MTALASTIVVRPPLSITGIEPHARPARVADVHTIHRLIAAWVPHGLTLPRAIGDILGSLGDFAVVETILPRDANRITACAALDPVCDRIAEIRSVAVDPNAARAGSGRIVVNHLVHEAAARGLHSVVLLTKAPGFFERCGFSIIDPAELPSAYTNAHLNRQGRTLVGRTAMVKRLG